MLRFTRKGHQLVWRSTGCHSTSGHYVSQRWHSTQNSEYRRAPVLSPEQEESQTVRKMLRMVRAFRNKGHFAATLDPLDHATFCILNPADVGRNVGSKDLYTGENSILERKSPWLPEDPLQHPNVVRMLTKYPESIDLSTFELNGVPLDKKYDIGNEFRYGSSCSTMWTIRELVQALINTYCQTVGVEFQHIEAHWQRNWLKNKIEGELGPSKWSRCNSQEQIACYRILLRCDTTAKFLSNKFRNAKVFGIEGCEALIPGLWSALQAASARGVEGVEMGMAHRGRMEVLHHLFQKPLRGIINMFSESDPTELGDVKYHLGTRAEIQVKGTDGMQRTVHMSLAANPSHLEAVCPVVIGRTKAKQFFINDTEKTRVMPILLHGDAAFSGQGIVPEVMELSDLPDYTVGGCIHIVVNNQIGFTTDPRLARTSYHCTNVAKGVGAPIFHVNGDDVEAVVAVCRLAAEWRQTFRRDCVVDIVCYRRHGHNSQDDPSITQPQTYRRIRTHPTTLEVYEHKLIHLGVLTHAQCEEMKADVWREYEAEFMEQKNYRPDPLEWLSSNWQGAALGSLVAGRPYNQTGVRLEVLNKVGESLTRVPDDFTLHADIQKLLAARKKALQTGKGITMAFAEALAFGCLMSKYSPDAVPGLRALSKENRTLKRAGLAASRTAALDVELIDHPTVHVRLSGQDCIRGTFNQRHAAIYCQRTGRAYWQLNNLTVDEHGEISVCNSSLSEAAILGFEYGYSLSNEMALTIWEAQFGDFANVAQAIIDNFIASGEHKWNNQSSLVMLLPHGLDGQGPEHSSARLERYLQLMDDDPDTIPGQTLGSGTDLAAGFDALDRNRDGFVTKEAFRKAVLRYVPSASSERVDLVLAEILGSLEGLHKELDSLDGSAEAGAEGGADRVLTKEAWCAAMASWLQTNSERRHNLIVAVPSTPAQYFHCLRRQIHRPFSKPVVIMSAKWLLHHRACTSRLEDMGPGTYFHRVILEGGRGDNTRDIGVSSKAANISDSSSTSGSTSSSIDTSASATATASDPSSSSSSSSSDMLVEPAQIRRIVFCSGKIFYHLYHARAAAGIRDVTLIRVEQIAPFPYDLIGPAVQKYPNAELVWVQEEAKNQGAWAYVKPRFDTTLRESKMDRAPIRFVGRKASASPASGGYSVHVQEQKEIIDAAFR